MGNNTTSRAAKKKAARRRQRNRILWILIVFLLILIAGTGYALHRHYAPTKEMADKKSYFKIHDQDSIGLICGKDRIEGGARYIDGKPYFSYEKLSECAGPAFFVDGEKGTLRYVTPEAFVSVEAGKDGYTENGKNIPFTEPILIKKDDGFYVSYKFVNEKTYVDAKMYNNPARIVIDRGNERPVATLKDKAVVRVQTGVKSPGLTHLKKGTTVFTGEMIGSWREVSTKDGYRGYIREESLSDEKMRKEIMPDFYVKPVKRDAPVRLAWDIMTNESAMANSEDRIASLKGVNVLSPTWVAPKDVSGNVLSLESADYVKKAHEKGIDVWMLASDFDFGAGGIKTPEETEALLVSNDSRDRYTDGIIAAAKKSGADGINVDFEHVYTDRAGRGFIEFIKELSFKAHKEKLIISVDDYVPQPYNAQYHRKEQGIFADYVVIMGYDEHIDSSEAPGPVDSLPFVKQGIKDTVNLVPREKVINAVPFYTRIWKQDPSKEGQKGWFHGITCSMTEAEEAVKRSGAKTIWDNEAAAYHAAWTGTDNFHYEVWLQDEKSLSMRLEAAQKEKIAGIAGWRLGYEKPFVWEMFENWK